MKALKKLLTAALATALPLATLAQPAPAETAPPPAAPAPAKPAAPPPPIVTVYGTLNVNFQVSELPGATDSSQNVAYRTGVSVDSSNVGVRAAVDVAQGMKVLAQCETSAQVDGVTVSGICNRNSRIGLSSGWGTLFYGNWDTPYKSAWYGTNADDPMGNTDVFDAAGILSSPGAGTRSTAGQTAAAPGATGLTFAVRAANSVAYHSPKFGGLSFKAQYSTDEFADNDTVRSPDLWSAGVNYDMGPFSVLAAYERHHDWNGPNTADDGIKAGVGYALDTGFGTTTLSLNGELLTYRNDAAAAGTIEELSRWAGFVGLKHRTGPHELRARYSMASEASCDLAGGGDCSAAEDDTGAWQGALAYAYHLSKAAQLYAFWTQIFNDDAARYTFATAGIAAVTPGPAGAVGADPWAVGLGMRYAF